MVSWKLQVSMTRPNIQMRKVLLFGIMFLGVVAPGYSQLVSFGIKAGVPLNDALNGYSNSSGNVLTTTDRWLVGPTAEVHLPFRLSFEVDALYRREGYSVASNSGFSSGQGFLAPNSSYSLNNWQFPFLAKYDLRGEVLRPFVDGGVTYRHLSGNSFINNADNAGITVGAGLTVKAFFLRLSPEIRYTHWGTTDVAAPFVTRSQNQADFLVGFTF